MIEGHNIFRFDLEYLEARARQHGATLAWGRRGEPLRGHPSRLQIAERTIGYRRYQVAGRHIVDTWILAQLYDLGARDLPSFGLKDIARHLGVAAPDRTYIDPADVPRLWAADPERLLRYALDDATETLAISDLLSPPYFAQAQLLPFDYQSAVLRGNATKIDALLLREYLRHRRAIRLGLPIRQRAQPETVGKPAQLEMPAADLQSMLRIVEGEHNVVRCSAFVLAQPAEADDVLIRKPALVRRLLDADVRREKLAVAPVQHEELGGSERTALQSVGSGALLEHLARQADLAGFSTAGDAGAEIHRIAAHRDASGQHRPPVRANAQPQLMLARARRIRPDRSHILVRSSRGRCAGHTAMRCRARHRHRWTCH